MRTYWLIPNALDNTICIFNCVASPDLWTLTETGKYCSDSIVQNYKNSLVDCQAHCKTKGARRLTFYPSDDYCICCTASSELEVSSEGGQIYTFQGKYMYLPNTSWCYKLHTTKTSMGYRIYLYFRLVHGDKKQILRSPLWDNGISRTGWGQKRMLKWSNMLNVLLRLWY